MMEGNTNQFIGSKISLISKSEIRYEGILYSLDLQEATISLAKVRSFGTEDRSTPRPVPPKDEIYEFIIFRGSDIKGIDVIEPPKAENNEENTESLDDPAILQVQQFPQGHVQQQQQLGHGQHSTQVIAPQQQLHVDKPQQQQPPPQQQQQQQQVGQSQEQGSSVNQPRPQQQNQTQNYNAERNYSSRGNSTNGYQPRGRGLPRGNYQQRGNYNPRGFRGGYMPAARGGKKLQFDGEFDFEKANEELQNQLLKIKISDEEKLAEEEQEHEDEEPAESFYQKDNFFDSISCEATERQKGKTGRPDWRAERKLNAETFGIAVQQQQHYGNYYYNNRGYYPRGNYNRGYQGQRGGYRGYQPRGNYRGYNARGQGQVYTRKPATEEN